MRRLSLMLLTISLCACGEALRHATAPTEGQQGIEIDVDAGMMGATGSLRNVGTYTVIPSGWRGPVPPGWVVYEGGVVPPPTLRPDEPDPTTPE